MASISRSCTRLALRPTSSSIKTATARNARFTVPRQAFRQESRRGYADNGSSGGPSKTNSGMKTTVAVASVAGLVSLGLYQFYFNHNQVDEASKAAKETLVPNFEDYQKVYDTIAKLLEEKDDYDDGSYGPVLLRLGWHASGTYDKDTKTGGSNGATMRFAPEGDHGANAGLVAARNFLEPIKAQFPWISYSDLWTLAAVTAVQEMQGPKIPWRPGRADRDVAFCTPDGRLPDASKEQKHLRAIFGRMGFDDREIVALSGGHALGRCHVDRSGFDGPWTFSPTVLTNDFYKLLIEEKWSYKKWNGPKQFEDVSTKSLMMLPTDMALIKDKAFRKEVERYAKDNEAFFKDFSDVVCKLFELGVPFQTGEDARWRFKSSFD